MEIEELKILAEKVKIAREEYKKASDILGDVEDLKKLLESRLIEALEDADLQRFDAHGSMFLVSHIASAKVPKIPEDRKKFFDYLKEREIFEDMITVHSATINTFVSDEEKAATERGEIDFQIPGLLIDYRKQLSVRKK
jgi:hypothetical protein